MNYKITLTDAATYIIKARNEDEAIDKACEWFSEREPDITITETDEPADDEEDDEEDEEDE